MPITINGTGTITGISAGGLPDGVVQPADLSTGAPSWTSGGDITLPSAAGTNTVKSGTGDGATRSTYNVAIKGWWGIAFQDYTDTVYRVLDCRDGTFQSVIPGTSSFLREYACRAFVNFNGTGTVAIRASGNVSSITDNGVGDFSVNFTNALPDANYSVNGMSGTPATADTVCNFVAATGPQTGYVRFGVRTLGGAFYDANQIHLAVFR